MTKEQVEFNQQFFPITQFHTMMEKWKDLVRHEADNKRYISENDYHTIIFNYRMLSDDVLIMQQDTTCHVPHRMQLLPLPEEKFYNLKFLLHQNIPGTLLDGEESYQMHQGFSAFYNNYANFLMEFPEGYHERNMQFVISHKFLKEYLNLDKIKQSALSSIIDKDTSNVYITQKMTASLKREIQKLASQVKPDSADDIHKLEFLKRISRIINLLLELSDNKEHTSDLQELSTNVARTVAKYLRDQHQNPFPGMEYLAGTFGISVSGLKRHFKQEFACTPHQYFQNYRMKKAREKLLQTDQSVTQLANQYGYENPSNFIRVFKKQFEVTPGKYREKHSPKK